MTEFSRQGFTGGPFNMPGRLNNGHPAVVRSEGTEYEQARRELARNPAFSILGSMVNPSQASLVDVIRSEIMRRQQQTGYSAAEPPGVMPPNSAQPSTIPLGSLLQGMIPGR